MSYQQARHDEPLIYELTGDAARESQVPADLLPESLVRKQPPNIPGLCERNLVRHFVVLSQMNFGVDSGFYPLGSCTMKYNPKLNDEIAALTRASTIHPDQPAGQIQGTLQIMHELQGMLAKITGMHAVTLQPAAGAHGEFTGMLITRAYHEKNGQRHRD